MTGSLRDLPLRRRIHVRGTQSDTRGSRGLHKRSRARGAGEAIRTKGATSKETT